MYTALYWIFCFSFAFDFRGEKGGSAIQYLYLAVALGSGLLAVCATPGAVLRKPTSRMTLLWWAYLSSTFLIAVLSRVDLSNYIRCVLPPVLCGIAILLGQGLAQRGYTAKAIVQPLLYAGMVSVVFRFIFAIFIQHIPLDEVRYEMLSPAIPLLFAAAVCSAILSPTLQWTPLVGGALAMASVLLSVTRSYILTLLAAAGTVGISFILTVWAGYWKPEDVKRKATHLIAGALMGVLTLVLLYLVEPMVIERWTERLFNNDSGGRMTKDATYLTREAEAVAIFHLLSQNPLTYVYGKGMGALYYWDSSYFPELLEVYPDTDDIGQDIFVPGHSVWTYALFSGGGLALACYVTLFGWIVFQGLSAGRYALKAGTSPPDMALLPFVAGVCYFSQTLTANPFGERFGAQILGLCAALPQVFYMRRALAPASTRTTPDEPSASLRYFPVPISHGSPSAHRPS